MAIYEPREDTFLLEAQVRIFSHGRVLDMGTGSGHLAAAAAKNADEVVACDINPEDLVYAKKKHTELGLTRNISYVESDLFSAVQGTFDLIIFNPPYLPDEPALKDVALDGGKEGWELIARFLSQASA